MPLQNIFRILILSALLSSFLPAETRFTASGISAEASNADPPRTHRKSVQTSSQKKKSKHSEPAPIDDDARLFVLEQLVPTKSFTNLNLLRSAMRVPRSFFLPKDYIEFAYTDIPIPLGSGELLPPPSQTLYMLEQIEPAADDRVWILGTGTGYPAAVLSPLVSEIDAAELIPSLPKKTNDALKNLNIQNVRIKGGKPEPPEKTAEPFTKILITGSAESVPDWINPLLADGGTLLIPIGTRYSQKICRFKKESGKLVETPLIPSFPVPLLIETDSVSENDSPNPILTDSFDQKENQTEPNPGWFNLRNVNIQKDAASPEGGSVLWFDSRAIRIAQRRKDALKRLELTETALKDSDGNDSEPADLVLDDLTLRQREEERKTCAVRSFPLNGKKIRNLKITCQMEGVGIEPERKYQRSVPTLSIVFFDANMDFLEERVLFAVKKGDTPWNTYELKKVPVPKRSESAEIRLGIMGGFGILKVDSLTIEKDL